MSLDSNPNIRERIGFLAAKADAAHSRIDKLETGVREDLKDINKELKVIAAYMNRGKGWTAAMMFIASLIGAGVAEVAKDFISKPVIQEVRK